MAERPADPETVKRWLRAKAEQGQLFLAAKGLRGATVGALNSLFDDSKDVCTVKRQTLMNEVFGVDTSHKLTEGQCKAFLAWAQERMVDGSYLINPIAVQEAAKIIEAHDLEYGQRRLLEE